MSTRQLDSLLKILKMSFMRPLSSSIDDIWQQMLLISSISAELICVTTRVVCNVSHMRYLNPTQKLKLKLSVTQI